MTTPTEFTFTDYQPYDFANRRHIGPSPSEMTDMLKAGGPPPAGKWADLALLEPVRDYKPRHTSTLLVFDAVADALDQLEARAGAAA